MYLQLCETLLIEEPLANILQFISTLYCFFDIVRYNVTIGRSRSGYDPSLNISVTVLMSTVLDIMDVQDQLCGLVRRMRNILDSQKCKINTNIVYRMHSLLSVCNEFEYTIIMANADPRNLH